MDFRKTPVLRVVRPAGSDAFKKEAGKDKRRKVPRRLIAVLLAAMVIAGAGILLSNHTFKKAVRTASYGRETSDFSRYAQFEGGIIRYSRDGIAFLNNRNEEQWICPCRMRRPTIDINKGTFAVADLGGNSIAVFTKDGMKGEMQTFLPIEKISVSAQGIVSAILKNEGSEIIAIYDAAGNILVEHRILVGSLGFPVALDISEDGETLMVSYLQAADGAQKSRIIFYNYGKAGNGKIDNIIAEDDYNAEIFPETHFFDKDTAAAVGDKSLVIYKCGEIPERKKRILLDREIKSVFYTDKYIGFILLNANKPGYEARLYNKNGSEVMTTDFTGEFTDIKMVKNEIIMTGGSKCLIITKNGVVKFKGDMPAEALEIVPLRGFPRYLVIGKNELNIVYLTK